MGPALDHYRHLAASRWRSPARASWPRAIPTICSPTAGGPRQGSGGHRQAASLDAPTHSDIRQGFVYERAPHVTLKSIANNAEIDVIWEEFQAKLEPLRAELNAALEQGMGGMGNPARR